LTVNQARLHIGVFAASALCLTAACSPPGTSADEAGTAASGTAQDVPLVFLQPAGSPERTAALVGGTAITIGDVRLEAAARELSDEPETLQPGDPAFREALTELIDQRLLALEAVRLELHEDPEARRRLAAAEERILGNILVETAVAAAVTDEAVERVYREQSRLAPPAEEVRARHILLGSREEAEEALRLLNEGADFAELAGSISQDPATRFQGGDLGYFTADGILPGFSEIAFSMAVGETSGPFETEAGWHVLTVIDRRAQPRPGLEALRPGIVRFLTLQGIDRLLEDIRAAYPVVITAGSAPVELRANRGYPGPADDDEDNDDEYDDGDETEPPGGTPQ